VFDQIERLRVEPAMVRYDHARDGR
jgi:hypothetical protein